jgi:DNA-binding NarL/FixJ family response regulator
MKVLLVDDHPLILSAMSNIIGGLEGVEQVICCETAGEACRVLAEQAGIDLVLLDLQLGDANGFDLLRLWREQYPRLPVVVVSASDRVADVIRVIDAGAMGFVPKRASNEMLFEALHLVVSGGVYVPPMGLSQPVGTLDGPLSALSRTAELRGMIQKASVFARESKTAPAWTSAQLESLALTPRQRDVLHLLLQGATNKMIARELHVSVDTVKDHVAGVLRLLGVNSRTQAVLAIRQIQKELAESGRLLESEPNRD